MLSISLIQDRPQNLSNSLSRGSTAHGLSHPSSQPELMAIDTVEAGNCAKARDDGNDGPIGRFLVDDLADPPPL